ncbi:MAG: TetR/AcrR family transcriptional regulator [Myxococcota bacterium]
MTEPTRERILESVAPVFAEDGFDGARTRSLAQAAGVNVATIAYHFGDKQGLYDALVDRAYQKVLELDLFVPLEGDREARLRAVVRTVYAFAVRHRVFVRILLRHVLETRRLPEAARLRWAQPLMQRAAVVLAQLEIPLDPDRLLAVHSLQHLVVRYAISEEEDMMVPHARVAEHLGDVACRLLL